MTLKSRRGFFKGAQQFDDFSEKYGFLFIFFLFDFFVSCCWTIIFLSQYSSLCLNLLISIFAASYSFKSATFQSITIFPRLCVISNKFHQIKNLKSKQYDEKTDLIERNLGVGILSFF